MKGDSGPETSQDPTSHRFCFGNVGKTTKVSRINNETPTAQKTNEGQAQFAGELDRKTGGSRNRCKDRNARRQRLLNDFEASSAADEHDEAAERKAIFEQSPPNQLVDCVVPADVLAKRDEISLRIKERGSVQSAGTIEDRLVGAQRLGQPAEHLRMYAEVAIGRAQTTTPNGFDRSFSAYPTTRSGEKVPLQIFGRELGVL